MTNTYYRLRLSTAGQALTPRQMHRALLSAIPVEFGEHPRAEAKLLWHRETDGTLIAALRSDLPFHPTRLLGDGLETLTLPEDGNIPVVLNVVRQRSRSIRGSISQDVRDLLTTSGVDWKRHSRGKLTVVPAGETQEWARALFARRGLDVSDDFQAHATGDVLLAAAKDRRERVPAARITTTLSACQLRELSTHGLGRCRNYGFGLPVPASFLSK